MNYLKQINAFIQKRKLCPISCSSIALYYVILERFNSVRFPLTMPISTRFLASELNVSETTVRNCRRELRDAGYIGLYIGKKGCEYRLIDLTDEGLMRGWFGEDL